MPTPTDSIDPPAALAALLVARLRAWSDGSLAALCDRDGPREEPGEALTEHLWRHRAPLAAWLRVAPGLAPGAASGRDALDGPTASDRDALAPPDELDTAAWTRDPVRWAQRRLTRWMHARNQFLALDGAALDELAGLCRGVLVDLEHALRAVDGATALRMRLVERLAALRGALAAFVRARLGDAPRDVACGHYSPALQLEVLGLDADALADPVLDIGCGGGAELVQALRARGHAALGIDRDVPAALGEAADWLRFDYGRERWGTVLSHLGFSLHFLHHHLAGRPTAYAHAEVFMQVLRSLRADGVFAYAPGLPFIEAMLPRAQYRVTRVPLSAAQRTPTLRAAELATGLALGQATQVRRLAT